MDYPQMELQILQYLSSSDMLNYCLALDKPMSTKLLPIFRKKIKNEVKKNRIKLSDKDYCKSLWVCKCKKIIEIKKGYRYNDEFLEDNPDLEFCTSCRGNAIYCKDCCVRCKYCQSCSSCIDCVLNGTSVCDECDNLIN